MMKDNRIWLGVLFFCLCFFSLANARSLSPTTNSTYSASISTLINVEEPHNSHAVIILSSDTIVEMRKVMDSVKAWGGKIHHAFPNQVLIGNVPQDIVDRLRADNLNISSISYGTVNASLNNSGQGGDLPLGLKAWNHSREPSEQRYPLEPLSPFLDHVSMKHLEISDEEKIQQERQYWEGYSKRFDDLCEQYKCGVSPVKSPLLDPTASQNSAIVALSSKALGAGYFDTSLYFMGEIAVGIYFTGTGWTDVERDQAIVMIQTAFDYFQVDEPKANLTFIYVDERNSGYVPAVMDGADRPKANDLRNLFNTDWAYLIRLEHQSAPNENAEAEYYGPSLKIYWNEMADGYAVRHETLHIFGAADQYPAMTTLTAPTQRLGYLNVINANSTDNDGKGYFHGEGEGLNDIMRNPYWGVINDFGPYTLGQIGWRDEDSDGIFDPLDTVPNSEIISYSILKDLAGISGDQILVHGSARDVARKNEASWKSSTMPYGISSVTLNTIAEIDYRINEKTWIAIEALDGAYNSGLENFGFTTPQLPNGKYFVDVRAKNSAGNMESSFARQEISISGSPLTNASPFAGFSILPEKGSLETMFVLDASSSSDLESTLSSSDFQWDFENDGVWDATGSVVNYSYQSPGTKTVRLQVRDPQGHMSEMTKDVIVEGINLTPKAYFLVSPGNVQDDGLREFEISLDASASSDPEGDPVEVRWDFNSDGIWDTNYSNILNIDHTYSLDEGLHLLWGDSIQGINMTAQDLYVVGSTVYVADPVFGLRILLLNTHSEPTLIGSYSLSGGAYDVVVVNNTAYIAGATGLHILDVSDPSNIVSLGFLSISGGVSGACFSGPYAYLISFDGRFIIADVSVAASPVITGEATILVNPADVKVSGIMAYVADSQGGLKIINVSNPASPQIVGTFPKQGVGDLSLGVDIQGSTAYLASNLKGLKIINVSDPASPFLISLLDTAGQSKKVQIVGTQAILADGTEGVKIVDVSNNSNPYVVGSYDDVVSGANSLFIQNSKVYVASDVIDLYFLDLAYVPDKTSIWKITMEAKDSQDHTAQTTRHAWCNTYNHSPVISSYDVSYNTDEFLHTAGNLRIDGFYFKFYVDGATAYVAKTATGGNGAINILDVSHPEVYNLLYEGQGGNGKDLVVSNSYLYYVDTTGLKIFNVSDPSLPVLMGNYPIIGANGIAVSEGVVYISSGSAGLSFINVSDPSSPSFLGNFATGGTANDVFVVGHMAYVANENFGLQIIDVTNPANPLLLASTNTRALAVKVNGNFAYVASGYDLKIFNISNPTQPVLVGHFDGRDFVVDVDIQGNTAYLADQGNGIYLLDVSNPQAPIEKFHYPAPTRDASYRVQSSGTKVYIAQLYSGIEILDLNSGQISVSNIQGSDLDINTTWDGILEYRVDIDSDGFSETKFSSDTNPKIVASIPLNDFQLTVEVQDRFHATNRLTKSFHKPNFNPALQNKITTVGKTLTFDISAIDTDSDNLILTASLSDGRPLSIVGAQFTDHNNGTGTFLWTPQIGQVGDHSIKFEAFDGLLRNFSVINIQVNNASNVPPCRGSSCPRIEQKY